jgi:hypothetical protein
MTPKHNYLIDLLPLDIGFTTPEQDASPNMGKFVTRDWRGIIAQGFTFDKVCLAAQGWLEPAAACVFSSIKARQPLCVTFSRHEVSTAFELGWSNRENGDLLRAAEGRFEVFVTTDQNLRYQQNLGGRQLAILVLPTTNWLESQRHQSEVVVAVNSMQPGDYRELRW